MKKIIILVLSALASVSVAHASNDLAKCPKGFSAHYKCTSTPTAGDNAIVSKMFDAISICTKGNDTAIAMKADGHIEFATVDRISRRAGGVTFAVLEGNDTLMLFSVGFGNPNYSSRATLTMSLDKKPVSSSYVCNRGR